MDDTLNILKNFESILKKCLIDYFGTQLPENKITKLNISNYINQNDYKKMATNKEVQGHILRKMLYDIIDVTCKKDIKINENEIISVEYGNLLQRVIIEDYAKIISQKYKFDINEIPNLANDLELVEQLKKQLDTNYAKLVINNDANNLIKMTGLKSIEDKLDEEAIEKYLEANNQLNTAVENNDITTQKKIIENHMAEENRIQFVYLDNELYLKYIDNDGKVHLVKINQNSKVLSYYKEKIASLAPNQKINPQQFFDEISEIISEEKLTETKDIKPEDLTHEEINMVNFTNANQNIQELAKGDAITHTDDSKIHVIEATNDIVSTNDMGQHVEGKIIEDKTDGLTPKTTESKGISPEQYELLCMKYARGETTKEEEELLLNSSPYLDNSTYQVNQDSKLLLKSNNFGIANKEIIIYLSLIGTLILFTIGYIIFLN